VAQRTIELRTRPPGQVLRRFWQSSARVQCLQGPLGSAKTFTVIQKILRLMTEQAPNTEGVRPTRWLAIRNTYLDLADTTIRDWRQLLGDLGQFRGGGSAGPPEHQLRFSLEDGTRVESDIIFLALDREDDVRKLRGTQITGAWCNEMRELPKGVVDLLDLRHGRYPAREVCGINCSWHGVMGDYNAPDDDHWLCRIQDEAPEGWEFFVQPGGLIRGGRLPNGRVDWRPNPEHENRASLAEKYPNGYYIQGATGKSDPWIAVNLANERGLTFDGRPIHPDFHENLHVAHEDLRPIQDLPLMIGQDWGLTPACVIGQRKANGAWIIVDELVAEDMGAARFGDQLGPLLRGKYGDFQVCGWGDPAGNARAQSDESTPFQILAAKGIVLHLAPSNDFALRVEAVDTLLRRLVDGEPGILIAPRCKMLIKALSGGYQFKRLKISGERYQDSPDKENPYSHVAEALQYLVLGAGEGRALVGRDQKKLSPVRPQPVISRYV